jgi:Glycosyl hydrolases family 2, TIM barrel domain/Glycosyl hydrolases family 2/Glycosyl hydrolases family 2, sugar binding domain
MFTRREFIKPLGVAAVAAGLPYHITANPMPLPSGITTRSRVSLNGTWQRYVNGEYYENIEVPSSQHPFGYSQLKRTFLMPQLGPGERAILHFEAIAYHGRAFINGTELGVLGPYTPFEFDATQCLRAGTNEVAVAISDLEPDPGGAGKDEIEFGINPGWEAYGGIIRDVYLEVRAAAYLDNIRFAYEILAPYASAKCRLTAFVSAVAAASGRLRVSLLEGEVEVASAEGAVSIPAGNSEAEVSFELKNPALWSPDRPNLYRLVAQLQCGSAVDDYSGRTGFRHTEIRGSNFYLNGEKIKLHGLSWLGTWKDQGFTLTRKQMALDMRGMKDMGCNFVRLHLFPQDRSMVELADELGMFVCEEPGYWQVDFTKMRRSLIELGLDILARTIRRDWNSPSVFAWLLSNESELTTETLREGNDLCRKLDPIGRFVSCANDRSPLKVKPMFDAAGLDFYSAHPYDCDPSDFDKACEGFGASKPLIFDEWGGRAIGQSQIILQEQSDRILYLMEKDQLAGEMFFSWNDFPEFWRTDGEMVDGVCESGVVSERREQREQVYSQVSLLFQGRYQQVNTRSLPLILEPLRRTPWTSGHRFVPVDLQPTVEGAPAKRNWSILEQRIDKAWESGGLTRGERKFQFWKDTPVELLGVTFRPPVVNEYVRPLVATPEVPMVEIPIGQKCARLHVLGQVTLPGGFPTSGAPGEIAAEYLVKYVGGRTQRVPLRNGIEICTGSLIYQASRIAPGTSASQKALTFIRDFARERYQVLLFSMDVDKAPIESLTLLLRPQQSPLLLFAVTVESA